MAWREGTSVLAVDDMDNNMEHDLEKVVGMEVGGGGAGGGEREWTPARPRGIPDRSGHAGLNIFEVGVSAGSF